MSSIDRAQELGNIRREALAKCPDKLVDTAQIILNELEKDYLKEVKLEYRNKMTFNRWVSLRVMCVDSALLNDPSIKINW